MPLPHSRLLHPFLLRDKTSEHETLLLRINTWRNKPIISKCSCRVHGRTLFYVHQIHVCVKQFFINIVCLSAWWRLPWIVYSSLRLRSIFLNTENVTLVFVNTNLFGHDYRGNKGVIMYTGPTQVLFHHHFDISFKLSSKMLVISKALQSTF